MMKILITGATGLIGKRLCRLLSDEGHEIVVLSRRPENAPLMPGIAAYQWEPEAGSPPAQAWEGVEAVINLAGESVAGGRWTEEQKRRIRDSRVIGTRNLIAGIKNLSPRPKALISASAVGFYGDRGDEVLTEASPRGQGFLSDVCQQLESEAVKAKEVDVRVVQAR